MKKLLFTLVSLFILFAIGCQENIIEPNPSDSFNKQGDINGVINEGIILLEGIVIDRTVMGGEYYQLGGSIIYEYRLLNVPPPIAKVSLTLYVNAELKSLEGSMRGSVLSMSVDTLYVNEVRDKVIKSFTVQGIGNNKLLTCSFLEVSPKTVILKDRWLEFRGTDAIKL